MKNFIVYTLAYILGIVFINIFFVEVFGNAFFLFAIFLGLIYNVLVIYKTEYVLDKYKFLNAGFIGVTTCFLVFNGGIIPLMYIKNFNFIEANAFGQYLNYTDLLKFVSIVAVGNIFFWFGYLNKLGDYIFAFYYEGFGFKRILKLDIKVMFPKILIVLGVGLNLVLFVNGAFGRGAANAEEFSGFIKILISFSSYLEKIALIGYFILALIYFKTKKHKTWYWATLIINIFFALLSGARGPIIFLFILTLLPYYYVNKRISKQMIIGGALAFVVAFTVASEIKVFTQTVANDSDLSLSDYTDEYMEFRDENSEVLSRRIYNSVYYSIMRRLNTVAQGSLAVNYKNTHGTDKTDPPFLRELITMPIYTIIPRSRLGSKFPSWGQWFRLKVLKQNNDTYLNNITFGPVGYYYLGGKWVLVSIGFFFYGICLRFTNNVLRIGTSVSFLLYLALISKIGYMAASVPTSYISFFRYALFLPVLFYIIIKIANKLRL